MSFGEYPPIIRAKTAPVKICKSLEEFKRSTMFLMIDRAISSLSSFMSSCDFQFDIESSEGQSACKAFFMCVEDLHVNLGCKTACRDYRNNFSKAYRVLYKDSKLCYLTEILDSAQECNLRSSSNSIRKR